jgi:hypothetical protein
MNMRCDCWCLLFVSLLLLLLRCLVWLLLLLLWSLMLMVVMAAWLSAWLSSISSAPVATLAEPDGLAGRVEPNLATFSWD